VRYWGLGIRLVFRCVFTNYIVIHRVVSNQFLKISAHCGDKLALQLFKTSSVDLCRHYWKTSNENSDEAMIRPSSKAYNSIRNSDGDFASYRLPRARHDPWLFIRRQLPNVAGLPVVRST
jgi:hypothetical protein